MCLFNLIIFSTVATYDKKLHSWVREFGHFSFLGGESIYSFGRGIRFSGQNCSIPASRGRTSRVSISYRRISYRMSPPYTVSTGPFRVLIVFKEGFWKTSTQSGRRRDPHGGSRRVFHCFFVQFCVIFRLFFRGAPWKLRRPASIQTFTVGEHSAIHENH